MIRHLVTLVLAGVAIVAAIAHARGAARWNEDLAIESPLARIAPRIEDPHTARLSRRVVLVVIDGLGANESKLPFLDELRARGAAAIARVPYPTVSRPNYVTILTGVPPRDSGVRANRVVAPVAVDTVMDRVRAAGLHVATASDYGSLASLFLRGTASLDASMVATGTSIRPAPPVTWPFDVAHRASSLAELEPILAALVASDAAFIPVLVLDVDRAGHASGVGDAYRDAAAAVDVMLRAAFAKLDLAQDAAIVTADHGHVSRGGHGGDEREVSYVPLVLAGKGVVAGAVARDARLIDIAPTVAALLGVPAPGHAEGRTLVELLDLDAASAARRLALDDARARAMIDAARDDGGLDPIRLAVVALAIALAIGFAVVARQRAALVLGLRSLAGATAFAAIPLAMLIVTGGHLSPSYIPSLDRVEKFGAVAVVVSLVAQVAASWLAIRRAGDRVAAANGLACTGLVVALGVVGVVRAWLSPPFFDVPSPAWMVVIPTLEIAAATVAAGTVLLLGIASSRYGAPQASHSPSI